MDFATSLNAEEVRYLRLLDRSVAPVVLAEGDSIVFLNPAAAQLLAACADSGVVGRRLPDVLTPHSAANLRAHVAALVPDGRTSPTIELDLCRLDGTTVRSQAVCARTTWSTGTVDEVLFGSPSGPVATQGQDWETVMNRLHEGVVIAGTDGTYEFVNAAARRILGATDEDISVLPMWDGKGRRIGPQAQPAEFIRRTGMTLTGGVMGVDRIDGSRAWVMGHGCLLEPDDPRHSSVLFSFTDVSEEHAARERLHHEANHDWLTGLPNRAHALTRAVDALKTDADPRLAAVVFIDLDQLKTVNDVHGHTAGDHVLRVAAQRMRSVVGPQNLLARLGGDEFIVLVFTSSDQDELLSLSGRVHAALSEAIVVETVEICISASIGVTTVDGSDRRHADEMVRDADAAMYRAKTSGPGHTTFF